VHED